MTEKTVELLSRGYEWFCPHCGQYNTCPGLEEHVTCKECGKTYTTAGAAHAFE